jgi:GNAT superfamily N-acetyltransferase
MNIRRASKSDITAIIVLTRQLGYSIADAEFERFYEMLLEKSNHVIFVATDSGGAVIAYIHALAKELLISSSSVEIGELIVDEHCRRRGVARQLVAMVEQWALDHGYNQVMVGSSSKRIASHQFYRSNGFTYWKEQILYTKEIVPAR